MSKQVKHIEVKDVRNPPENKAHIRYSYKYGLEFTLPGGPMEYGNKVLKIRKMIDDLFKKRLHDEVVSDEYDYSDLSKVPAISHNENDSKVQIWVNTTIEREIYAQAVEDYLARILLPAHSGHFVSADLNFIGSGKRNITNTKTATR